MKIYIWIAIAIVIIAGGVLIWDWNMKIPQPLNVPSLSPSTSSLPSPKQSSSLKLPLGGVSLPKPSGAPLPSKTEGTVFFAIKDKAESLDNFRSILAQLSGVSVHGTQGKWISVKNTPPLLDLLKIYRTEQETAFLAALNLPVGTYDQLRLDIGSIVLMTKDGMYHETKLPSKRLMMNMHLIIEHDNQSAVIVDIMSDKSIHKTGNGKYVFMPVINLETRSKLSQVQMLPTGFVTLVGGKTDMHLDAGMDEQGELKKDFSFGPTTEFEIIENAIHIIPPDKTDEMNVKIPAQQAIDIAIKSGGVSGVISVKIIHRAGKVVWQVTGFKEGEVKGTVFVNVLSGLVEGTE